MQRRLRGVQRIGFLGSLLLLPACEGSPGGGTADAAVTADAAPPDAAPVELGCGTRRDPVDSNMAADFRGGGCYPISIHHDELEQITYTNPEWAAVVEGVRVDSEPVLVHGTVMWMHGDTGGDFPANHVRSDVNAALELDPEDRCRLATGNLDGEGEGTLEIEWEAGGYPAWAWPGQGDRLVAMGRWIFDCGHPDTVTGRCVGKPTEECLIDADCRPDACPDCAATDVCANQHFRYQSELHPPHASAVIRRGRGAVLSGTAMPATRVDVFVSPEGGAAADRCAITHHDNTNDLLFGSGCFPLAQPLARINAADFTFDVPLPPRPAGATEADWAIEPREAFGGRPAELEVVPVLDADPPVLRATVKLTRPVGGAMPTGFGATLRAGWKAPAPAPLVHLRVKVDQLRITDALRSRLTIRDVRSWHLQVGVNGEWQEVPGLDAVSTGDLLAPELVFEQWLPADGALRLTADGTSRGCIDTLFGRPISADLDDLGIDSLIMCLRDSARSPGKIDLVLAGPDFGAGAPREVPSKDADGGGSAFSLRFTIDRLP